jgi:hypothetical protein
MANTTESFDKSFQYFLDHEAELTAKYKNRVIVIYIDKVLGVYTTVKDAYLKAPKEYGIVPGTFIIQNLSESANSARMYQSNVSFSK